MSGSLFQPSVSYAAGAGPNAVVAADVNGDGIPDLVVSDYGTGGIGPNGYYEYLGNGVSVLLGDGSGGYAAPAYYAAGETPYGVTVANLNGHPDLVVTNHDGLRILLGDGSGSFSAARLQPIDSARFDSPLATVAGDVNGDGRPDLVVTGIVGRGPGSYGTIAVLLGQGGGSFALPTQYPDVGEASPTGAGLLESPVLADMNGDGILDLVAEAPTNATVRLGDGSGGFGEAIGYASTSGGSASLAVADVNGDGRPDVVVAVHDVPPNPFGPSGTAGVDVFLGDGSGRLSTSASYAAGGAPASVAVADLDGDGHPDLVVVDANGGVSVLRGNGSGGFSAATTYDAPGTHAVHASLAVADVNGDGRPDVVVADASSGTVEVLTNIGSSASLPPPSYAIAAADADKAEAASGPSTPFTFTVTRSGNTSAAATLRYAVTGAGTGQAATPAQAAEFAGGAYPSGVVRFGVGQTTATLTVPVATGQTIPFNRANQEFAVTLGGPAGTAFTQQSAVGVIRANFVAPAGTIAFTGSHDQYAIAPSGDGTSGSAQDQVANRDSAHTFSGPTSLAFSDGVGVFDPTGNAGEVARLYQAALGRTADLAGLNDWAAQLNSGTLGLPDVAQGFVGSTEFQNSYGPLSDQDFVARLYQNVLGRAGDANGTGYWTGQLAAGEGRNQVLLGFSDSQENKQAALANVGDKDTAEVVRLYQAAFNRAADGTGLDFWTQNLDAGATPLTVAQGFAASAEFAQAYGGKDAAGFVAQLYGNVLHRAPDTAGGQFWVAQLNNGASQAQVLLGFADSTENRAATAAATHDGWVFLGKGA